MNIKKYDYILNDLNKSNISIYKLFIYKILKDNNKIFLSDNQYEELTQFIYTCYLKDTSYIDLTLICDVAIVNYQDIINHNFTYKMLLDKVENILYYR